MTRLEGHIPEDQLRAFVAGEVDEPVAVRLAEHIDACVTCATRAATAEPLTMAFASVPQPHVPPALVAAILRDADRPDRGPIVEIAVGIALLLVAVLLTGLGGDDAVRLAIDVSRWLQGIQHASAAIGAPAYAVWLAGVALIGVGAVALGSIDREAIRWRSP